MNAERPKIDFDYLAHVCQQDTAFMREMIEAFVESIPLYSSELKSAYEHDHKVQVAEVIHKLKPLFAYLKLEPLYQETKALQSMTLQERQEGVGQERMKQIFQNIQGVVSDLKAYLSTHP